jgi:hypothetical protein
MSHELTVRTLVHGSTMDPRRCGGRELAGRCYVAGPLIAAAQEGRGDHNNSHHGRQSAMWWRRRACGGDTKAVANPSEDRLLGARRGDIEWHNVMQWGISRWRCLL